jgi:NADPH-dependent curcumin reductase CurA
MGSDKNRQMWLTSRPNGIPPATDFAIREVGLPQVSEGTFLVHNKKLPDDRNPLQAFLRTRAILESRRRSLP